MPNDYLFVYGTLRRETNSVMAGFLAKNSRFVSNANYCGILYQVDDYPAVVPSDNLSDSVYGEVYRLHHADKVLARLDDYEECSVAFALPHEYVRQKQVVLLANGQSISAWMYLYNRSTIGLRRIDSGDFLRALQTKKTAVIITAVFYFTINL